MINATNSSGSTLEIRKEITNDDNSTNEIIRDMDSVDAHLQQFNSKYPPENDGYEDENKSTAAFGTSLTPPPLDNTRAASIKELSLSILRIDSKIGINEDDHKMEATENFYEDRKEESNEHSTAVSKSLQKGFALTSQPTVEISGIFSEISSSSSSSPQIQILEKNQKQFQLCDGLDDSFSSSVEEGNSKVSFSNGAFELPNILDISSTSDDIINILLADPITQDDISAVTELFHHQSIFKKIDHLDMTSLQNSGADQNIATNMDVISPHMTHRPQDGESLITGLSVKSPKVKKKVTTQKTPEFKTLSSSSSSSSSSTPIHPKLSTLYQRRIGENASEIFRNREPVLSFNFESGGKTFNIYTDGIQDDSQQRRQSSSSSSSGHTLTNLLDFLSSSDEFSSSLTMNPTVNTTTSKVGGGTKRGYGAVTEFFCHQSILKPCHDANNIISGSNSNNSPSLLQPSLADEKQLFQIPYDDTKNTLSDSAFKSSPSKKMTSSPKVQKLRSVDENVSEIFRNKGHHKLLKNLSNKKSNGSDFNIYTDAIAQDDTTKQQQPQPQPQPLSSKHQAQQMEETKNNSLNDNISKIDCKKIPSNAAEGNINYSLKSPPPNTTTSRIPLSSIQNLYK